VNDMKVFRDKVVLTILIIGLFSIMVYVASQTIDLILMLFLASILAIFIRSMSTFFQNKWRLHRRLANGISIFALICFIVLPFTLIWSPFTTQTQGLLKTLPSILHSLEEYLTLHLGEYGLSFNNISLNSLFDTITNSIQSIVSGAFIAVGYGIDAIANVILTFFIASFIAVAPNEYSSALKDFFPPKIRGFLRAFTHDLKTLLQHWIVGTLLAMLFVGSLATLGYWIVGLKYFVVFGVIAGFMEIIPYFGPTLSAILPALFALTQEPSKAIPVIIISMLIQLIENYFFIPFLWKKQVNIPPAISIFIIILFGQLLGFLGILLAIPIFLVTRTLSIHIYNAQQGDQKISANDLLQPSAHGKKKNDEVQQ
jgi:predicted PurR-regulated permease PerM